MKVWIIGGLSLAVGIAACSNQVDITREKASATQGAGGAGSSGVGSTSGASSSTGAGAGGPGFAKVITADTDIGQAVSFTTPIMSSDPVGTKVMAGPLLITDVILSGPSLYIVQGDDCSVPEDKHINVVYPEQNTFGKQFHGMRLPVLAGQTACSVQGANTRITVFGFRPY
jgi:hypothetical protein